MMLKVTTTIRFWFATRHTPLLPVGQGLCDGRCASWQQHQVHEPIISSWYVNHPVVVALSVAARMVIIRERSRSTVHPMGTTSSQSTFLVERIAAGLFVRGRPKMPGPHNKTSSLFLCQTFSFLSLPGTCNGGSWQSSELAW